MIFNVSYLRPIHSLAMLIPLLAADDITLPSWKDLGQFAGIVVTVMLFLRYMSNKDQESGKRQDEVMKRFEEIMTRVEGIQKSAEAHINAVSQEFIRITQINQQQMQKLFDDYMQITRQNVELVVALKGQLEALKQRGS